MINRRPHLQIDGQLLREKGINHLVKDSENYLKLILTFSEEWQDLEITGYFVNEHYPRIYSSIVNSDGTILVPNEIEENFKIYFMGRQDNVIIISTNSITMKMETIYSKSVKEGGSGGSVSSWEDLEDKPFERIGETLAVQDGTLDVNIHEVRNEAGGWTTIIG